MRKIDRQNRETQDFWTDLIDLLIDGLDQREEDPRVGFVRTGSEMCYADKGHGKCPACCVIMGRLSFGEIFEVVSASVMCKSCEDVARSGFLISPDYFIQLAPLSVNNCGE